MHNIGSTNAFKYYWHSAWLIRMKDPTGLDRSNILILNTSQLTFLPFSNWHFGPGLFDLLIMTLQGQTFFHLACSLRTLISKRNYVPTMQGTLSNWAPSSSRVPGLTMAGLGRRLNSAGTGLEPACNCHGTQMEPSSMRVPCKFHHGPMPVPSQFQASSITVPGQFNPGFIHGHLTWSCDHVWHNPKVGRSWK